MSAIDWSKYPKTQQPAVNPSTIPWRKTELVWCPEHDGDVMHFAKGIPLKNGCRIIDLACEHQCDPDCRYYNEDFQKEYGVIKPQRQTTLDEAVT